MLQNPCPVCDLPAGQACELCAESTSMFIRWLAKPEPACAPQQQEKINIASGEDVCLAY